MKGLRYICHFVNHVLFSNSRHGTHSPFVYGLAANAVYRKPHKRCEDKRIANRLVNEIADYLGVSYTFSQAEVDPDNALCIENVVTTVDELAELQHQFRYVVLYGIYGGKNDRSRWREISRDARFIVTVDLFYFGLIFYRKEQPKQHFRLRFPFWKYLSFSCS